MMSSLIHRQRVFADVGGLSHLVEAATALSELMESQEQQRPVPSTTVTASACALPTNTKPALITDDDDQAHMKSATTNTQRKDSSKNKKDVFPQKLLEILSDTTLTDIVSWLPHGRSFVVIRPDLFCEQVLPRYLPPVDSRGSTKYPSFTRKLNRWGFRQATRGADTGAFHHPYFRRDQPGLCTQMVCQKSRDRQVHQQKQKRSLPPKKRAFAEASPVTIPPKHAAIPVASRGAPTGIGTFQARASSKMSTVPIPKQAPANVSSDDGSVGNSSTSSSSNEMNSINNSVLQQKQNSNRPPVTAIISPATVIDSIKQNHPTTAVIETATSTRTTSTTSSRRLGGALPPAISNDAKFVAEVLRQRDTLEMIRAAKGMLYDAYMKAVREQEHRS